MKKTVKLLWSMTAFAGLALTGCDNAEYKPIDNYAYIASAPSVVTRYQAIESTEGVDVSFGVRLSDFADMDVKVYLAIDPALVEAYNTKNGTSYSVVTAGQVSFLPTEEGGTPTPGPDGFTVTIPKGKISVPVNMRVARIDMEIGEEHAFGVKIKNVAGGGITNKQRMSDMLFAISMQMPEPTPLTEVQAATVKGVTNGSAAAHPDNDWNLLVDQFTIEWWSRMTNYTTNNRAIFSNWGSEDGTGFTEVYVRFGDATQYNGLRNYLQAKCWGGQWTGAGGNTTEAYTRGGLLANVWYHFAMVWDGSSMNLYRNGVNFGSKFDLPTPQSVRTDGKIQFQTLKMFDSGPTYFNTTGSFSQVRFWKTARTPEEIKANMYKAVYEKDKNLVAYWPMDGWKEGTTDVFEDITGNGNDMTVSAGILQSWETVDLSQQGKQILP